MTKRRLPVQQLVILSICRFAEPIALTSVFPYLPSMIESFNVPKNEIAKWAGVASAIFSLTQCMTGIFWGAASDRYGRKTIILVGLFNTLVTSLLWGFSVSLPMALLARALAGAGNGNVGILRTMVAEMCPWKELQPRAFSIMPLVYNIGSVFGPALGGALSNPLHVKPGEPRGNRFLEKFPFALPNIVAACLFLTGIITGLLFLHETLETRKNQRDYGLELGQRIKTVFRVLTSNVRRWWSGKSDKTERQPLLGSSKHASDPIPDEESASHSKPVSREPAPGYREVLTRQSVLNLMVYTLLACYSIGYDQVLPVFMHHPRQDTNAPEVTLPLKFAGGFGIDSDRIGLLFTLYGIWGMCFQLFVFPPVARCYGVLRCLRVCSCILPISFFITPFTSLIPDPLTQQIVLFLIMLVKGSCNTFSFPCSTILITNTASSLRVLGTLNGIATSVSAIGRAAGPALCGAAFTLGVKHGYVIAPFWILTLLAIITACFTFTLVEGAGFGDDDAEPSDSELEDEGSGYKSDESRLTFERIETEETDYGSPGPLVISRTVSNISSAAVESEDEDATDEPELLGERRHSEQRNPQAAPHPRVARRRSSVPIGSGVGFRRLSSNLGQSLTGGPYGG